MNAPTLADCPKCGCPGADGQPHTCARGAYQLPPRTLEERVETLELQVEFLRGQIDMILDWLTKDVES